MQTMIVIKLGFNKQPTALCLTSPPSPQYFHCISRLLSCNFVFPWPSVSQHSGHESPPPWKCLSHTLVALGGKHPPRRCLACRHDDETAVGERRCASSQPLISLWTNNIIAVIFARDLPHFRSARGECASRLEHPRDAPEVGVQHVCDCFKDT